MKLVSGLIAIVLPCLNVTAAEPPQLSHNPFSRPPSEVTVPQRSLLRSNGPVQMLDLRATMVASNDRLANVAGKVLRLGEEFEGYTLLQVFEDHAVFAREGSRLTVYVNPELEDDVK